MAPVGVAVTGTVPRVCDLAVFPCRGLCAAACAQHPAALPLGLWPGLLQDGAAVSGQAKAFPVHTKCSGWGEVQGGPWVGFIIHVAVLGWGLWEAQLPFRLSPICKSKQGMGQAFQVSTLGMPGSSGDGQGSPRCPGLVHRVIP